MKTKEDLEGKVSETLFAFNKANAAFEESKSEKNKKGDKKLFQAMEKAEEAYEDAKFDLDDFIENGIEPDDIEDIPAPDSTSSASPAPEGDIENPVIRQRGVVYKAGVELILAKNPPVIAQRGRVLATKEKLDPGAGHVILQKGRIKAGSPEKIEEYKAANPPKKALPGYAIERSKNNS